MKLISKRDYIIAGVVFLIILIIAIFYFYPIPQAIKEKEGKIQRCFYLSGIGTYIQYSCTDCGSVLYNRKGEVICQSSTWSGKLPTDSPCLHKICFSIYSR